MYRQALSFITVLFFMMGFITCLNDILVPYLKQIFSLSYAEASLIQFCFFGAYGLTSIPSSKIIEKIGYKKGMILGFCITALGCLLFYPAVWLHTYVLFLLALFILASGIVLLQVAANPYVSVIGPKESASSRLTMVQAFNSLGTFLAPFFGSYFLLSNLDASKNASAVLNPYLGIAVTLLIIALILSFISLPLIKSESVQENSWGSVLKDKNLILGMLGIFAYVGAEVSIGSFLVNYVISITPMSESEAASLVGIYWGGAMVGRFLGIYTLKKFPPSKVLMAHGLLALGLVILSLNSKGDIAVYSMILVGLCHSIMFPTIFTLGIRNLSAGDEQKGSGLLATSILGGAIVPVVTGFLLDLYGFKIAFLLPAVCYVYIAYFGLKNSPAK